MHSSPDQQFTLREVLDIGPGSAEAWEQLDETRVEYFLADRPLGSSAVGSFDEGKLVFRGLDRGLYVVEGADGDVDEPQQLMTDPILVPIPLNSGDQWLHDVQVYPKTSPAVGSAPDAAHSGAELPETAAPPVTDPAESVRTESAPSATGQVQPGQAHAHPGQLGQTGVGSLWQFLLGAALLIGVGLLLRRSSVGRRQAGASS